MAMENRHPEVTPRPRGATSVTSDAHVISVFVFVAAKWSDKRSNCKTKDNLLETY